MKARVISAIIAALLLIGVAVFLKTTGTIAACCVVFLGTLYEYSRLTFRDNGAPLHLRLCFFILSVIVFGVTLTSPISAMYVFVLCSALYSAFTILTVRRKNDLPAILKSQMAGLMGFVYAALFPALCTRLLLIENGQIWFFGLLAMVFAGDTFAYFTGRNFGKNKLLEAVSPQKTIEGAIGGLVGSAVAGGALAYFFLPHIPIVSLMGVALVTGIFAQVGDLFESLLKRVAEVKDSGSIMPGHGGLLDRVDGVYFAAPVYFVLVQALLSLYSV